MASVKWPNPHLSSFTSHSSSEVGIINRWRNGAPERSNNPGHEGIDISDLHVFEASVTLPVTVTELALDRMADGGVTY